MGMGIIRVIASCHRSRPTYLGHFVVMVSEYISNVTLILKCNFYIAGLFPRRQCLTLDKHACLHNAFFALYAHEFILSFDFKL